MATMEVKFTPEDLKAAQSAERIPEPTAVVIFGASGDLTKRKLLPALFHLEQSNLLPSDFSVVGVARRPLQDEFRKDMRDGILQFGGVDEGAAELNSSGRGREGRRNQTGPFDDQGHPSRHELPRPRGLWAVKPPAEK